MEKRRLQPEAPDMGASRLGLVNHLRLTVTDIERARQFYGPLMRFLGYEVVDDAQERLSWGKQFSTGVLWFILTAAREDVDRQPHDLLSRGFHHLAWNADSRDQIDEVHQMMCRNGATVLDTPAEYDYEPGYYAVFFADPDHADTQTILSNFLTRLGARVIIAGDAETALQEIQQCHPNVVLSDIGLPQKSGFELLKEIRLLDSPDRHVPAVAMTALGGIVERQRAIASGFQELLRKPFDPAELLRVLQSVLR